MFYKKIKAAPNNGAAKKKLQDLVWLQQQGREDGFELRGQVPVVRKTRHRIEEVLLADCPIPESLCNDSLLYFELLRDNERSEKGSCHTRHGKCGCGLGEDGDVEAITIHDLISFHLILTCIACV